MPELPDVTVYVERLNALIGGLPLERVRVASPFLVRSVDPPIEAAFGSEVLRVRRLGKRVVFALQGDLYLALHLMIAGRLHWKERQAKIQGKIGLAAFDFPNGTVTLTEASTKKPAALHLVRGEHQLVDLDRGGLEPLEASAEAFRDAVVRENHTLKRALTDPRLLSGIGNAYSDEILHRARLSPVKLTHQLSEEEIERLRSATRVTLEDWVERLRREAGDGLPEKVTAFRDGMAVHGR